ASGVRRRITPNWAAQAAASAAPSFGLFDAFDRHRHILHLRADLHLDAGRNVRVGSEEILGRLATLAEARLAGREPGAGLGDDIHGHTDVQQAALAADALAIHHVELGDTERRRDLVL